MNITETYLDLVQLDLDPIQEQFLDKINPASIKNIQARFKSMETDMKNGNKSAILSKIKAMGIDPNKHSDKIMNKVDSTIPESKPHVQYAEKVLINSLPKDAPKDQIKVLAKLIGAGASLSKNPKQAVKAYLKDAMHMFDQEYSDSKPDSEQKDFESKQKSYQNTDAFYATLLGMSAFAVSAVIFKMLVTMVALIPVAKMIIMILFILWVASKFAK